MELNLFTALLQIALAAGTSLLLAALGELVAEKAGVLNLGIEGMMALGAFSAFAVTFHTGQAGLGVLAGVGAGMALALAFAVLTLNWQANQVAAGLALAILGTGLSALLGKPYEAHSLPPQTPLPLPLLADLPIIGAALFTQHSLVYVSWLLLALTQWFLLRTQAGLKLRAVGESPAAAHLLGLPVQRIRYLAVLFGGALAGLAGAYLSVFHTPLWVEGMVAGRGWIAAALVVFAAWRPLRVLLGAYLFGGMMMLQLFIQGSGARWAIPAQGLAMLPYLATLLMLVVISRKQGVALYAPLALGKPFRAER